MHRVAPPPPSAECFCEAKYQPNNPFFPPRTREADTTSFPFLCHVACYCCPIQKGAALRPFPFPHTPLPGPFSALRCRLLGGEIGCSSPLKEDRKRICFMDGARARAGGSYLLGNKTNKTSKQRKKSKAGGGGSGTRE